MYFDLIFLNKQLSNIENNENPFVKFFNTSKYSQIYNVLITKTFTDYKNEIKDKDKKHFYELHRTLLKFEKLKAEGHLQNHQCQLQYQV